MGLPLWIKTGIFWWTGFILRRVELLLLKSSTLDLYSIPLSSKAILTLAAKGLSFQSSRTTSLAICCTKRIKIFLSNLFPSSICNVELRRKLEFIAEHETFVEFSVSLVLLVLRFCCHCLHQNGQHYFWKVGIFLGHLLATFCQQNVTNILLVKISKWIRLSHHKRES